MDKVTIHEFDPVIYPFRLWVAVKPSYEQITSEFGFIGSDGNEIAPTKEQFMPKSAIATTYYVYNKKDSRVGSIVLIWSKKELSVDTIAHESTHVTDLLCDKTNVSGYNFEDGEARAYFTGWVAGCIDKVKRGKA